MIDNDSNINPFHIELPTPIVELPANPMHELIERLAIQTSQIQSLLQPIVAQQNALLQNLSVMIEPFQSATMQSLKQITSVYSEMIKLIPPSIEWFQGFDFSSILAPLLDNEIDTQKLKELNAIYLMAMYECKWFPYAGSIADETLFETVDEIIATSRGISKRREKRIDNAILAYYTDKEVKRIKSTWWNSDLDYCLKRSLCQAVNAYLRKEYVLTISCLATMWEGLIYIKAHNALPIERQRQKMKITMQDLSDLTKSNRYDEIFSDYFNNFIVSQCDKVDDVVEGVPNRHGTSHSWYKKYPNKKAALNAILLTDFIINLKPMKQTEEKDNG